MYCAPRRGATADGARGSRARLSDSEARGISSCSGKKMKLHAWLCTLRRPASASSHPAPPRPGTRSDGRPAGGRLLGQGAPLAARPFAPEWTPGTTWSSGRPDTTTHTPAAACLVASSPPWDPPGGLPLSLGGPRRFGGEYAHVPVAGPARGAEPGPLDLSGGTSPAYLPGARPSSISSLNPDGLSHE